jgi:hypothetical protein
MLSKSICSVSRSAQRRRALRMIHWFSIKKTTLVGTKTAIDSMACRGVQTTSSKVQRLPGHAKAGQAIITLEAREARQKTLRTKILGRGHGRQLAIRLRRSVHLRGVVQCCGRDKCIRVCGLSSGLALPRGLGRRPGETSLDNRD